MSALQREQIRRLAYGVRSDWRAVMLMQPTEQADLDLLDRATRGLSDALHALEELAERQPEKVEP